jgi:antitoxin VapB
MSKIVKSSTFKSGNSVAVRLPKEFGIGAGQGVELVQRGRNVEIRPVIDLAYERAQLAALAQELAEIGPIDGDSNDGRIEFPDRPGLY